MASGLIAIFNDPTVLGVATSWTVRGSNSGRSEIFRTRPHWPWGPPNILYDEYRVSFVGDKAAGAWL